MFCFPGRGGDCAKMGIMFATNLVDRVCVRLCPKCWEESDEQELCIFFCVLYCPSLTQNSAFPET